MTDSYFQRVAAIMPTRLWVNNPTAEEIDLAIVQGAVGCTTNPSYGGNLLRREPAYVHGVVDAVLAAAADPDDAAVAERVQEELVKRITDRFRALYYNSERAAGYVSLQGSPHTDDDPAAILRQAHAARSVAPNVAPKLPATEPGLAAFETLVSEESPSIVTEVFSVAQLMEACERYQRVTAGMRAKPPFFVSPITGIFGDHLRKVAARDGINARPQAIGLAGVALARRCHAVTMERRYPVILLFGGARSIDDFTRLVGARTAATINYSTIDEIVRLDPPVEVSIDRPVPGDILDELLDKFPDFRRAWTEGGLSVTEFEAFGPVQHFRDSFVSAWDALIAGIHEARSAAGARRAELSRRDGWRQRS